MFKLHERLEQDSIACNDLKLCHLRILPDSECPWVVLIPRRENIREIYQLDEDEQQILMQEISFVSKLLQEEFAATKINVGALGNMVPQLHVHVICRFEADRAWPGAIWGNPDTGVDKQKFVVALKNLFK